MAFQFAHRGREWGYNFSYRDLSPGFRADSGLTVTFMYSECIEAHCKLNPQTVLFIGYSDDHLGYTGIDILQKNRTFFIKIGYAWLR